MLAIMTTKNATYQSTSLRFQTAEILERVQAGERVTITRRGVPVAYVVPITDKDDDIPEGWHHGTPKT